MAGLREEALTQLCMLLKPFMAMAGDVVYRRGEGGSELYLHAAFILILAGIHIFLHLCGAHLCMAQVTYCAQ